MTPRCVGDVAMWLTSLCVTDGGSVCLQVSIGSRLNYTIGRLSYAGLTQFLNFFGLL